MTLLTVARIKPCSRIISLIPILLLSLWTTCFSQKHIVFETDSANAIIEYRNTNPQGFSGEEFYNDVNDYLFFGIDGSGYLQIPKGAYIWSNQDIYLGEPLRMILKANGNIGLGQTVTEPTAQLHTNGTVRFANFGAGTLTTDSLGNLTVSSDERLKVLGGDFTKGLDALTKIQPINFHWKENTGFDFENNYVGFSAQNVLKSLPEAVKLDGNGYYTLSDRPIIAALVNSVKELRKENEALKAAILELKDLIKK